MEGYSELEAFATACNSASVVRSDELLVGRSEAVWAEKARPCELVMICPVEKDFRGLKRCFGSRFWKMAMRAGKPLLVVREGLPTTKMVMFSTNLTESARVFPIVASICSELELSLTVYCDKWALRGLGRDEVYEAFADHHNLAARLKEEKALQVIDREARHPGSMFDVPSLLVFDGGFHKHSRFGKHRRAIEQLLRTSQHCILLCP